MSTDATKTANAVIIGAGIVGVTTALELSKNGYNVTVIERFPLAAQFCSMGNAGVIREHVAPSQFKSVKYEYQSSNILQGIKSLLPTFKPNYSTNKFVDKYFFTELTSYKWLYAFAKSTFNKIDPDLLDKYDAFCFNSFISNVNEIDSNSLSHTGYAQIFAALTSISKMNASDLYNGFTQFKSQEISVTVPEQQKIDNITIEMYPKAFTSDCHAFSNKITKQNDINFRFNTEAKQILIDKDNNVYGVEIEDNTVLKADKIVICAGILTNNIVQNKVYQINANMERKKMKLPYIPIAALQGYSISVPYSPKNKYKYPFNTLVYFPSNMYVARINDNLLRFANYGYMRSMRYATNLWNNMQDTMESRIGIQTNVINPSKFEISLLNNLENCIKDNLLSLYDIDREYFDKNKIIWSGFRPYTPDALPIVDKIKNINGLYINAGHGFLGWTSSHGTAKLMGNLINNKHDDEKEKMFLNLLSLDRF